MRIALVVHKFPPDNVGGVETYSWSLARALAKAGHDVHVFYPIEGIFGALCHEARDGISLWRVPLPAARANEGPIQQFWHTFRDRAIEASFIGFLARVQPEIVHFQHVQGVSAKLILMAAAWPSIVTLHDYWFFCANSQLLRPDGQMCAGPKRGWNCVDCLTVRDDLRWLRTFRPLVALPLAYRNLYLRRAAMSLPLLLAPSEFLREQYIRQGFPAQRILAIELGLDTERLLPSAGCELSAQTERSSHPSSIKAGAHFGYLGSLAPHKGVHVLVEAFNQLPDSAALTIYGSEEPFPAYARQLRAATMHPKVSFAGPLDYRNVGEALRQLDCLVVPSIWYENSPLVIQEAYGVGIPVVASRLGALAEKVRDAETGRLFTAGDSVDLARVLRELIDQPEQLPALRANIRRPPTMEQHVDQILSLYKARLSRSCS